ncbi:response regulator [Dyadobacter psychrotolerans]|uniref:histidine kinase n=1 Tax=Dyadobacter psychrotolerans TaxID=2541721 RepID=A0A4R5DQ72_9BACT|nr:response regulator [Dyadobacter psychrotolerans]TDE13145.1 response regulator [Dyadobacter psychrotolerans]
MNRNRKILLFFLVNLLLYTTKCNADTTPFSQPAATSGILDLRKTDLDRSSIPLRGEWKFFWNSLQNPARTTGYFEYSIFPKLWSNTLWKNKSIPSQGFATYELKILLPKSNEQLALKLPEVYCSYNLFVNSKLVAKNGRPGTTKETTVPYWSDQVKPILISNDTLNIVLQISNFHHLKGGASKEIKIGLLTNLQADSDVDRAIDYFLTGCIFMGGFFFLGLYLFGRHDKSILYFSLFCLFYSYRILGSRQYTLQSMFPDLSWTFTIHCEYLSLFMAVAMFTLYTRYLYPEDAPQRALSVMTGVCLAFALITVITPPILFTRLIDPFIFIVIAYIAFAVIIYWKAVKNKRVGANYALVSTFAIFIIIICVILEYYGIATPFDIVMFLGYLIFFFCQSLILTFKFAYTLKKAKEAAELGLKVKSEFLSTMSHEIRTPLNSVIGMTHLMMKDVPRPDQKEHLDVLLFSANNLLTIVNDVLDFSTIEEGKISFNPGPMDVTSIARNIISGYKAAANNVAVNFILDLDNNLPSQVSGDSTRTSQIISNLVHNAIKFTSAGHVKLSVKEVSRNEEEITLKILVEDTGIGIPLDKQKMVFERFTQADSSSSRNFSGTGLGLAISKRILELQGIELYLESEPGKGSVFYFTQTFPILKEKIIAVQPQTERKFPLENVKILIVEDNPMNVLVLKNFLKRWGAVSEVAQNGKEALEILDSSKHQIILMDMHMPVMDGYEATKQLRSKGETIPVIALTASVALNVDEKIYGIGINDIVVKPFVPEELLNMILKYVR